MQVKKKKKKKKERENSGILSFWIKSQHQENTQENGLLSDHCHSPALIIPA